MEWYRRYHGTVSDPKLAVVAKRTGQHRCVVIAVWDWLLELASAASERGDIDAWDAEECAIALDIEIADAEAVFAAFQEKDMHDGERLSAWDKRQFRSDDAASRMRRHRERQRNDTVTEPESDATAPNSHVTSAGSDVTEPPLLRNCSPQNRAEQSRTDSPPEAPLKGGTKRGCRLPEDWKPDKAFAAREGLAPAEVETEAAKFQDHWRAKAGAGGVKLDWSATWRNWVREAKRRGGGRGPAPGGDYQPPGRMTAI